MMTHTPERFAAHAHRTLAPGYFYDADGRGYDSNDARAMVRYYRQMRADLAAKRITPASIIGRGYVGNTRRMANTWIDQKVDHYEGIVSTEYGRTGATRRRSGLRAHARMR